MIHGFLNIDKPAGITSHDVVAQLRRLIRQKRIGHGGTLDPMATGVLPIALGEATRLIDYLVEGRKGYHATIRLGITTTTDDAEGVIREERPVPPLTIDDLQTALQPFVGTIQQVPPMYSAIQVDGQRMYDLARRGETVELAPRTVEIDQIDVVAWATPIVELDIVCGKGTYIRAVARDLGSALGCGAHLAALRRTRVGSLMIDMATPLGELRDRESGRQGDGEQSPPFPVSPSSVLLPPETAIADWPRADVDDATAQRIRNGLPVMLAIDGALARAHTIDGTLLALLRFDADQWRPFKVFNWA